MDIFAQKKLLVRLVVLLAILNFCTMGIVVWKEVVRKPRQQEAPAKADRDVTAILEKELGLDRDQAEKIKRLRNRFNKEEERLTEAIRRERDSMNTEMFSASTRDDQVQLLARKIAENEYNMELLRFEQAKELKSICTPEQVEKFNVLVREMRDFFRPGNKQNPGNRQASGSRQDPGNKQPPGQRRGPQKKNPPQ